MSNYFGSSVWAAARPRTTVPSARALALLPAAGHPSLECGTGRLSGLERHVDQHVLATSVAAQPNARVNAVAGAFVAPVNAQVKDTGIRMSLGPPPWRPPE